MEPDYEEQFFEAVLTAIEKYGQHLPPCEVTHRLVYTATSYSLNMHGGSLHSMHSILSSVQAGIDDYMEEHEVEHTHESK